MLIELFYIQFYLMIEAYSINDHAIVEQDDVEYLWKLHVDNNDQINQEDYYKYPMKNLVLFVDKLIREKKQDIRNIEE